MTDVNLLIRTQYEEYPFPNVLPRDERRRLQMVPVDSLGNINHICFKGRRIFDENFRVLVAGGGTGHSTIYLAEQLRDSGAEVVYLDLSQASMVVAQERAKLRGLDNIKWVCGSITDLPTMALGPFDYISCTGVLHHLPDPNRGLQALKSVLKVDGAMGIMVYATYGRQSYYHIQALMEQLNEPNECLKRKIINTREAMESMPSHFYLAHGIHRDRHLKGFFEDDSNLVDTFLHSQDRSYTIPELYKWLEDNELSFNDFSNFNATMIEKIQYCPELYLEQGKLLSRVQEKPLRERHAIAELLNSRIGLHTFYVSAEQKSQARPTDPHMVPYFAEMYLGGKSVFQQFTPTELSDQIRANTGETFSVLHAGGLNLELVVGPHSADILGELDGKRTIREIFSNVRKKYEGRFLPTQALFDDFSRIFSVCSAVEWMRLRHVDCSVPRTYDEMQNKLFRAPDAVSNIVNAA
ncbi:MAG: class I SAM-dependent methyltransferase [Myxococcota bacterium]|nr:class I SAM-dependent methyltransferase [Myxococcota bacterium]